MPKFGNRSQSNLATCDEELQLIANETIKEIDFTVIQGRRGEREQTEYFTKGTSKVKYPNSKHNKEPSQAFDFIPCPFVGWSYTESFKRVGHALLRTAIKLKAQGKIKSDASYGGDWKSFKDYPHFQIDVV